MGEILAVSAILLMLPGCANHLSEDQKVKLRDAASPYQQRMLMDLVVSEDEYRTAVTDAHTCVAAAGAIPDPVKQIDGQQLGFGFEITAASESGAAPIQDAADKCLKDHMDVVARIWVSQSDKLAG